MSELRAAVIGLGMIGRIHARAIRSHGARLVAVVDRTSDEQTAKAVGAERSSDSFEDTVRADDIDVVHVCLPNHLHAPVVRMAIAAGKHVVCEKPLATSLADAEDLAALATAAGVVTAVPFGYRFSPSVREARARVQRGDLGELQVLHGHYLQDWLLRPGAYNWRVDPEHGGASRAFADIGSHLADMIEFVSGHRIRQLVADMSTAVPTRLAADSRESFSAAATEGTPITVTTEDTASVLFRTDRGGTGTMLVSQISPGRKNRLWFELDGSEASVTYDLEDSERLLIGSSEGIRVLPRDPVLSSEEARRYVTLPAGHPQGLNDWFAALVADTYDTIAGAEVSGLPTFADGLRAARITDAVMKSAQSRSWVQLD